MIINLHLEHLQATETYLQVPSQSLRLCMCERQRGKEYKTNTLWKEKKNEREANKVWMAAEVDGLAKREGFRRADDPGEDVLTYALFGQVGLKFLKNRNDPSAFEPPPSEEAPAPPLAAGSAPAPAADAGPARYRVNVNGTAYDVEVSPEGAVDAVQPARPPEPAPAPAPAASGAGEALASPLSGTVRAVRVQPGQPVAAGDVVLVLEAMKMETNVSAPRAGRIVSIAVQADSQVRKGDPLLYIS